MGGGLPWPLCPEGCCNGVLGRVTPRLPPPRDLAGLGVLLVLLQPPASAPQTEGPYDMILPRASTASPAAGSASSTLRAEDAFAAQARHTGTQRDGRSCQVG